MFAATIHAGENSVHTLPSWMAKLTQAQMDTLFGLLSNEGVDIVGIDLPSPGSVWIGTTQGLSYTDNQGENWFTFNETNGLNEGNVSALFAVGDTIWIATVSTDVFDGQRTNVGHGLQFSIDGGDTWETPSDTVMQNSSVGPLKIPFDIASDGQNIFSANFVGGLIGSGDNGVTWTRFHLTQADRDWFVSPSGEPPFSSRYFSVVVDTGHTDTTIFWAGSSCGIARYDFVGGHIKPSSNRILDHAFDSLTGLIYLAGDRGLSRGSAIDYTQWTSVFSEDGLPSNVVNEVHIFGGKLFVNCLDSVDGDGVGFVWTDPDLLGSFSSISGTGIDAVSSQAGAAVHDLLSYNDRYLYLAGGTAGLFVSVDTGLTWSTIPTGLGGRGSVYSLAIDTTGALWCGTDSGLVTLYIDRIDQSGEIIDSQLNLTMYDHSVFDQLGAGGSVRDIEFQMFPDTLNPGQYDSVITWTANFPASDTGSYSVNRLEEGLSPSLIDTTLSRTSRVDQMASRNANLYFAGTGGLRSVVYSGLLKKYLLTNINTIEDAFRTPRLIRTVNNANSIFMHDTTTHISSNEQFAVTHKPTLSPKNWRIAVANTSKFTPDSLAHYQSYVECPPPADGLDSTIVEILPGSFVPAMGVQHGAGSAPIIWAACRPGVTSDEILCGVLCFDPIGREQVAILDFNDPPATRKWKSVPGLTNRVWNFAFNGPEVFIASSAGLFYRANPTDSAFIQIEIVSSREDLVIEPEASVNGVAVIGSFLWVATGDGFAMAHIDSVRSTYRVFQAAPPVEEAAYAYPVPFRPDVDLTLKFSYTMPSGESSSTIEIYDFAMNLVRVVSEDVSHLPNEDVGGHALEKWDGLNGEGTSVVPGIYYFRVSFSNGESSWGKLAVIP